MEHKREKMVDALQDCPVIAALKSDAGLEKAVRDLTVIALNRMGTEGEKARSEGGENYTFDDAPKQIYDTMNRFRLARVGGKAFEASKK